MCCSKAKWKLGYADYRIVAGDEVENSRKDIPTTTTNKWRKLSSAFAAVFVVLDCSANAT